MKVDIEMITANFVTEYEKACAYWLEENLESCKIALWADAFTTNATAKQKALIFFGHQRTTRTPYAADPVTFKNIYLKRYIFELRCEFFTLRNHQESLDLIEFAIDDVLADFRPFQEFSRFIPQESGNVIRNKDNGTWVYSATGYSEILSSVKGLTSTVEVSEPKIVQIGYVNAQNDDLIGRFVKS